MLLVDLAAAIAPGDDVKPPYEGRVPYRRVENIARFLAFCRDRGVAGADLFDTVDLAELKDLGAVVRCLVALSAALRKAGAFAGPFLATSRDALASAVDANLRVIVAVGEYRDRHRHVADADQAALVADLARTLAETERAFAEGRAARGIHVGAVSYTHLTLPTKA